MQRIYEPLYNEYNQWKKTLKDAAQLPSKSVPTEVVLRAHYLLCDYFIREGEDIAKSGPRDKYLLPSAVARQSTGFCGVYKWTKPMELVATLFYGLVKNHSFHDGNKRTALLIALYQLSRAGRVPDVKQSVFEQLVVRTAANRLGDYTQFRQYTKKHPVSVDARVYFLADFFRSKTGLAEQSL